ncbi:YfdX family protein, partial [Acinetobacter baumannii]
VPMSVAVVTKDVYTSLDAIKKAKADAEQDLRAGRVQEARRLLDALVSETVISTTNIPLATYPDALKKSAKLIDENKTVEAKAV